MLKGIELSIEVCSDTRTKAIILSKDSFKDDYIFRVNIELVDGAFSVYMGDILLHSFSTSGESGLFKIIPNPNDYTLTDVEWKGELINIFNLTKTNGLIKIVKSDSGCGKIIRPRDKFENTTSLLIQLEELSLK